METKSKSETKVREIDKKISILEQKLINEQDQCGISDLAKICETINNLQEQKRQMLRASGSKQPSNDSMTKAQRELAESILRGPNSCIRPDQYPPLDNHKLDKQFDHKPEDFIDTIEPRVIKNKKPYKPEAGSKNKAQAK